MFIGTRSCGTVGHASRHAFIFANQASLHPNMGLVASLYYGSTRPRWNSRIVLLWTGSLPRGRFDLIVVTWFPSFPFQTASCERISCYVTRITNSNNYWYTEDVQTAFTGNLTMRELRQIWVLFFFIILIKLSSCINICSVIISTTSTKSIKMLNFCFWNWRACSKKEIAAAFKSYLLR